MQIRRRSRSKIARAQSAILGLVPKYLSEPDIPHLRNDERSAYTCRMRSAGMGRVSAATRSSDGSVELPDVETEKLPRRRHVRRQRRGDVDRPAAFSDAG